MSTDKNKVEMEDKSGHIEQEEEDDKNKYDKTKNKKVEKKEEKPNESLIFLQLELTRFFGFFAISVMSILRLLEASILDCRPIAA